jgi:hypothetical protein
MCTQFANPANGHYGVNHPPRPGVYSFVPDTNGCRLIRRRSMKLVV